MEVATLVLLYYTSSTSAEREEIAEKLSKFDPVLVRQYEIMYDKIGWISAVAVLDDEPPLRVEVKRIHPRARRAAAEIRSRPTWRQHFLSDTSTELRPRFNNP